MSWLSSIGSAIGNAVKKVSSTVGSVVKTGLSVVKTVATPLLSTAAAFVPGVGPLLSKGVDILGNMLLGSSEGDPSMDSGQVEQSPVMDAVAQATGQVVGLGSSPVAQAMSAAVKQADDQATSSATSTEKKGFLGIGDGKPGVFGIGTGKAKAKKAARDLAEAQARAEGTLSPIQIKLAGDKAEAQAEKDFDNPSAAAGTFSPIALAAAAVLALFLL